MALKQEQFSAALSTIESNSAQSIGNYWETYNPNYQPYVYPTHYIYTTSNGADRLKFALELIEQGDLTKDQMVRIAQKALRNR